MMGRKDKGTEGPEEAGDVGKLSEKRWEEYGRVPFEIPDNLPEMRLEMQRIMHKLKVHQLELEMQQEELNQANIKLEKNREHYNDLYDFSPIGLLSLTEDGTIEEINLTCTKIFGINRSNLLGARFGQFIAINDRIIFKNFLNHIFVEKTACFCEIEIINLATPRFFRIDAVLHKNRRECQATLIDITDQKNSVLEKKRLEVMLSVFRKVEFMKRASGHVVDDFYNAMQEIIKKTDLLLQSDVLDSASREHLHSIRKDSERSLEITGFLSALGRKALIAPEKVDVNAVLSEKLDLLKEFLGEKITVSFNQSINPAVVFIDRGHLDDIITCLVENAQEAMTNGGMLSLKIEHKHLQKNEIFPDASALLKEYICLEVRDTGQGMTHEVVNHLFEPFFSTKSNGTGLGIPIVQSILKLYMGFLTFDSKYGEGTSIGVFLPCYGL